MALKAIESATAVIGNVHLVYPKDEADKVIAELNDKLKAQTSIAEEALKLEGIYRSSYAEAVKELYEKNKKLRRQKYKRCLAMARWCADVRELMHKLPVTDVDADRRRMKACKWCRKWRNRWLDIADKFKEGV